jgi:hypothetical protein
VLDERGHPLPQPRRVLVAQVDLVLRAVHAEVHRLIGRTAIKIVH